MLENPLLIRRLPSISCLLGNQSPRCIKEADFIIRVWRSYDSDLPKVIQKVNDRLGNKLNLGNKSNQMQDLVLKELLFTSKKKTIQNKIFGEIYICCKLTKLILFFLPSSQLRKEDGISYIWITLN